MEYNGGPGAPNNLFLPYYKQGGFSSYFRELRDVLVIEKRGTGASQISCKALDTISLFLDYYMFNTDLIKSCLEEVQKGIDLSQYNTAAQVEDLEEVRKWLEIEHFDFHGMSYGTRVGLEYLRKYPKSVKSAILTGSVPPKFGLFEFVDREIEQVLKKLIQRCEKDSICNSNFPNFEKELYELKRGLKNNAITYIYAHEKSAKKYEIIISEELFASMLAKIFFSGTKLEQLPKIIHEAYVGNYSPLITANISSYKLAIPLHLSQFCPEEANPFTKDYFYSMDTLFSMGMGALVEFRACQVWQKLSAPEWLSKNIGADTPLLLFSGEDDVLTPPRMNDTLHALFPNSIHLIFKDQGHGFTDWSCWDNIVYQFLENNASLSDLDTACLSKLERPAFSVN